MRKEDLPIINSFKIAIDDGYSKYLTVPFGKMWRIEDSTLSYNEIDFRELSSKERLEFFLLFEGPNNLSSGTIWIPQEIEFRFNLEDKTDRFILIEEAVTQVALEDYAMENDNDFGSLEQMLELRKISGFKGDNYVAIATMVASYYMELNSELYKSRFKDECSLLTTVGVLDAQEYIFKEKNIAIHEIKTISIEALKKENPLLEFTIGFGILIFKAEEPSLKFDELYRAWNSNRVVLNLTFKRVLKNYPSHDYIYEIVKSQTAMFFSYKGIEEIRGQIGIKNVLSLEDDDEEYVSINEEHYEFMAESITYYYSKLRTSEYNNRSWDLITLLTIAGVLEARVNIPDENEIPVNNIKSIAKEAAENDNSLLHFVIGVGSLICMNNNPHDTPERIEQAWVEKRNALSRVIEDTLNKPKEGPSYEIFHLGNLKDFLFGDRSKNVRKIIGIR